MAPRSRAALEDQRCESPAGQLQRGRKPCGASADDQEAVQLSGVDYRHVFGIAAALAFATVALGGIVLGVAQQIGSQINSSDGFLAGYIVFLAVLILRPQGLTFRRTQS